MLKVSTPAFKKKNDGLSKLFLY